ncbi:MAG: ribosome silencing factor [Elusimicrobiota bacterium]
MASARAADEKKGAEIVLLHVRPVSTLADYVLLVGITSVNHLGAVEEHIARTLKELGYIPNHKDGRRSDQWRVLDYGGLIIHLLHPRARTFYSVDRLFPGARKVSWGK